MMCEHFNPAQYSIQTHSLVRFRFCASRFTAQGNLVDRAQSLRYFTTRTLQFLSRSTGIITEHGAPLCRLSTADGGRGFFLSLISDATQQPVSGERCRKNVKLTQLPHAVNRLQLSTCRSA